MRVILLITVVRVLVKVLVPEVTGGCLLVMMCLMISIVTRVSSGHRECLLIEEGDDAFLAE